MTRKTGLIFFFIMLLTSTTTFSQNNTFPLDKITKGMKGHGVTVFSGTNVEIFDVEVLGILKNTLPKMDAILVRLGGKKIERYNIIAGMSGSPVYFDGKLAGAIAFGFEFSKEPIAAVTPIKYMDKELSQRVLQERATPKPISYNGNMLQPQLSPLFFNGVGRQALSSLAKPLQTMGFLPLAAGGSKGKIKNAKLIPGSSFGVQLIRGDLEALAIGTVTQVEKNRVLALGHPFLNGGKSEFPMTSAYVNAIVPMYTTSIKLASSIADIGTIVQDRSTGIIGMLGKKTKMIPVDISIKTPFQKQKRKFKFEVIKHKFISPGLIGMGMSAIFNTYENYAGDNTIYVDLKFKIAEHKKTIKVSDAFFNVGSSFHQFVLLKFNQIVLNPFKEVTLEKLTADFKIVHKRNTAFIRKMWVDKDRIKWGDEFNLYLLFSTYDEKQETKKIKIILPKNIDYKEFYIEVVGGEQAPTLTGRIRSFDELVYNLENHYDPTDIVVRIKFPNKGIVVKDKILTNIPSSTLSFLYSKQDEDIVPYFSEERKVIKGKYIVSGKKNMKVKIEK